MPEMDRVDPDISTTDILVCGKISKAGEKTGGELANANLFYS